MESPPNDSARWPGNVSGRGYDVLAVFDDDTVWALRSLYDSLDGVADQPFYASNVHASRSDARRIDDAIRDLTHGPLSSTFPGHRTFIAAFISKRASDGGVVGIHQDWTYTDERSHRATLLWVPLVDTAYENGAMHAIAGSHRWTNGIRPSGAALPTDELQDRLWPKAELICQRAGSALVYDPALLHGSSVNRSSEVRPAVAIGLVAADAPLVHFYAGNGHLVGTAIDDTFFTSHEFGTPPEIRAPLRAWTSAVTAAELTAALDRP